MASCSGSRVSSGKEKLKYNAVCGGNEDLLSALLNEELDIDSENDVNFEILSECGSEDCSDEVSQTESESDISDVRADGWEGVTRNPNHTHLLKMKGHSLIFYQMLMPWVILVYFSMMSF
jgi:hypothetical protein